MGERRGRTVPDQASATSVLCLAAHCMRITVFICLLVFRSPVPSGKAVPSKLTFSWKKSTGTKDTGTNVLIRRGLPMLMQCTHPSQHKPVATSWQKLNLQGHICKPSCATRWSTLLCLQLCMNLIPQRDESNRQLANILIWRSHQLLVSILMT